MVDALRDNASLELQNLAETDPGEPQTIMLLGSDRRPDNATDGGAGTGARSDTIILVRLDPDKGTALMSLPRDLKVEIPGHRHRQDQRGLRPRRPQAHAEDGEPAHRPVGQPRDQRRLPGLPEGGRRDRLHLPRHRPALLQRQRRVRLHRHLPAATRSSAGRRRWSTPASATRTPISCAPPASRRCCARPNSRSAQASSIKDRDKLIKIFGKYTTSDASAQDRARASCACSSWPCSRSTSPIREVHFEGEITDGDVEAGLPSYVTASNAAVKRLTAPVPGRRGDGGTARRRRRQEEAARS